MSSSSFAVQSIDHVVLTVASIQATVDFYTKRLGMTHETFVSGEGVERHALRFGSQKINLHLSGHEFEPKASRVQPGSGDLCFITQHPIDEVLSLWKNAGIEVSATQFDTSLFKKSAHAFTWDRS
ncbi:hypothetical protein MBLNU13_g06192t1 [Cladosporium sp. NU13]